MSRRPSSVNFWQSVGARFLPFADAASNTLPLARILRLALFQVSVGIAAVLLNGTLNRVMIVELETPAWVVALMIAIPLLIAPFRALIGYRSDTHISVLGWRRVPYIWFGTMAQFGGLAIMPFALVLLTRPDTFPVGLGACCLSFLLTGAGMHVTQTAGLALATDIAAEDKRPSVVALLYVMLLAGMMLAAFTIGNLLADFSTTRLVQVIQGAAALTIILNIAALWKQEARHTALITADIVNPGFFTMWASFTGQPNAKRLLLAIGVGAMAFAMQDALLEPYGGEILGLSVGSTTSLTGAWALGALIAFAFCAKRLPGGSDPLRLAGFGVVAGVVAFLITLFAGPLAMPPMLFAGAAAIGFGTGLFSVGTMIAAMSLAQDGSAGMALGAWGAVQASAAGLGIALGGLIRDGMTQIAMSSAMGTTLADRGTGYSAVYTLEVVLLLITLLVLGPIVGQAIGFNQSKSSAARRGLELQEFPT
ncbi:BCD family MFS transporter [Pontixanthobacter sp.]|uniref:BCD family MFS transporter n=1 Tax=Pontixanthobacter sp. TaxID=2792078 RepID=UPI003C7B7CBA